MSQDETPPSKKRPCKPEGGCAACWHPVDWLLASKFRTNSMICAAVAALAFYIDWNAEPHTLLTDGLVPCAVLGLSLAALFRWLRKRLR